MHREFHVERIDEPQVVATFPRSIQQGWEKVALKGSRSQTADSRCYLAGREASSTLESTEGSIEFAVTQSK